MNRRVCVFQLLMFACSAYGTAQEHPFVGNWFGAINLPAIDLDVSVTLREENGALSGTIDIPSQQMKAVPLSILHNDNEKISFAIPKMTGDPTFTGALSQDGRYIFGEFTQGSGKFRFHLTRAAMQ